jgi:protein O-mannosyl-transferase
LGKSSGKEVFPDAQRPNELPVPSRVVRCLPVLFLLTITFLAYLPMWHAGYIWTDDRYVTSNPDLHSVNGLYRIWFKPGGLAQYYPLTFTTYWVEYRLWGLSPLGYHLVNVLLQALNAILFWQILRKLKVPGALLAAAIFALHPVGVESVAWITERKNTLSGFFFLASILAGLKFWNLDRQIQGLEPAERRWIFYWFSFALYVLAIFSKTTTIPLPGVIVLLVWWKRGKVLWRDVYPLLLYLCAGVAMGLITMRVEHHLGATAQHFGFSLLQRCLIAGRDIWFYLGKLVWPYPLIFVYPLWKVNVSSISNYLPLLALVAVALILLAKRKSWGRPTAVALTYFVMMLFLLLGFFNVFYFRYSFVADHFQYLASLGPFALVAAGIVLGLGHLGEAKRFLVPIAAAVLLTILGVLTWRQCGIYVNLDTLWRTTAAENPNALIAHNNLGYLLLHQGETDAAIAEFQKGLEIDPNDAISYDNLGGAMLREGLTNDAVADFHKALQLQPDYALADNNLGHVFLQQGDVDTAISYFQKALKSDPNLALATYNLANAFYEKGQLDSAVQYWQRTVEIQPDSIIARNNLGNVFLHRGNLNEAEEQFQQILKIQPAFADAHNNLASVLIQKALPAEAAQQWEMALELRPDLVPAMNNLAWVLATCPQTGLRNGAKALELSQRASRLSGDQSPIILRTLAAAYAETGSFADAKTTAQQAEQLAVDQSNLGLAADLQQELGFYEAGLPFRDTNQLNSAAQAAVEGN